MKFKFNLSSSIVYAANDPMLAHHSHHGQWNSLAMWYQRQAPSPWWSCLVWTKSNFMVIGFGMNKVHVFRVVSIGMDKVQVYDDQVVMNKVQVYCDQVWYEQSPGLWRSGLVRTKSRSMVIRFGMNKVQVYGDQVWYEQGPGLWWSGLVWTKSRAVHGDQVWCEQGPGLWWPGLVWTKSTFMVIRFGTRSRPMLIRFDVNQHKRGWICLNLTMELRDELYS